MKKIIIVITLLILFAQSFFGQQCFSFFTYNVDYEIVTFQNKSNTKNAHYYWNFGDGTSSYFEHPIHNYVESGTYFVTLFLKDTVTNCSSFYEEWIEVVKYTTTVCQAKIDYELSREADGYYVEFFDRSYSCDTFFTLAKYGGVTGVAVNFKEMIGWSSDNALFMCKITHSLQNSLGAMETFHEAYKTFPFLLENSLNYGECSANFEFKKMSGVDSSERRVFFYPMNKKAKSYKWIRIGYGIPIITYNDTMSFSYFPYFHEFETITLITEYDSGCRDTMTQQIQLKDEITTIEGKLNDCELNILISPNPINDLLTLNFEIGDIKPNEILIIDEIGKVVYEQKGHFNLINYQYQINLDTLNSGLYFLSMKGDCYNYKSKFIKID